MASNKEIESGAKAIADDMMLPGGGRKKLARIVEAHVEWFDAVETRGLTIGDISRLLFAAGATAANGRPIPVGTLSSAIWRKRNAAAAPEKQATPPVEGRLRPAPAPRQPEHRERDNLSIKLATRATPVKSLPKTKGHRQPSKRSAIEPVQNGFVNKSATSKDQTLAFMKRAAAIRRGKTD